MATEGYGAEVVLYDPRHASRDDLARALQQERGGVLVPPYDHPDIIAGQGTATLELHDQAGGLDMLLVPCGGGGLLSGSAVAARGGDLDGDAGGSRGRRPPADPRSSWNRENDPCKSFIQVPELELPSHSMHQRHAARRYPGNFRL